MKKILCLTVCALSLLAFASTAQSKDAQANGTFDFSLEGAEGMIVFDADSNNAGEVHGQMLLTATVDIGDPEGDGSTASTSVSVEAQFDCLLVNDNQAAMSGVVTSANAPGYVGQQVLLVVVDKVEGISPPTDAFAWGVYVPTPDLVNLKQTGTDNRFNGKDYDFCPFVEPEEVVADECDGPCPPPPSPVCIDDPGITLTWNTADAELYPCPLPTEEIPNPVCPTDPNGVVSGLSTIPTVVTCDSFALSAYPLNLIDSGHGNKVQVKHNP